MKMTDEEKAVHDDAFSKSKAKSFKGRMADADAAVDAVRESAKSGKGKHVGLLQKLRDRPKSIMEAVDQGVEDGTE